VALLHFHQIKSYGSTISNSEYYDALDFPEKPETIVDDDRTSSDDGSFSSEDEGEADSINSEVSEPPKFGKPIRCNRRRRREKFYNYCIGTQFFFHYWCEFGSILLLFWILDSF